ncbi:hypothetical protein D9M71_494410 [compost metagenome]
MRIGTNGAQKLWQLPGRDVCVVLRRLGLQKAIEAFERLVNGAAGDAGEVVDFLARATHTAHLLNDALLLHTSEELHPLDGQDLRKRALAEDGEDMKLQGADCADSSVLCPTGCSDLYPLSGQFLERIGCRLEFGCLLLSPY